MNMTAPANYSVKTLSEAIGYDYGLSDPIEISQEVINGFADATGDHQWIHVDVEKATKEGPFGGTIAHGYLTLSILAGAAQDVGVMPHDARAILNYGLEKVRFLAPVPAGSSVRARFKLVGVEPKGPGNQMIRLDGSMHVEGSDKPALVAELIAMVNG
jgi:acyl dehydratase